MKTIKLDRFWAVIDNQGGTNSLKDTRHEAVNLARIIGGKVIRISQVWYRENCIFNQHEAVTA